MMDVYEEFTLTTAQMLRVCPDSMVRQPLWDFAPADRLAVLHERRRRFGIEEERIDVTTLTDDEDLEVAV
ncbi:hypothetical protein [Streptomyces sp. NPDC058644]|uniref:hypothetical protein n=1 Tax=unclassified Streptomyces TaxID=2593676 RepID=UPI0036632A4D